MYFNPENLALSNGNGIENSSFDDICAQRDGGTYSSAGPADAHQLLSQALLQQQAQLTPPPSIDYATLIGHLRVLSGQQQQNAELPAPTPLPQLHQQMALQQLVNLNPHFVQQLSFRLSNGLHFFDKFKKFSLKK